MGGLVQEAAQKTILVVDDEDGVRESVREALSDEGYRVVDAADGTEVLRIINEHRPELVLLDIWMPQVDGIGLLKEIKSQNPDINVVMVSGHGNIHTAVRANRENDRRGEHAHSYMQNWNKSCRRDCAGR